MGPTASGSSELLFSVLPFNVSLYMSFRTLLISETKRNTHTHHELTTSIRRIFYLHSGGYSITDIVAG